MQLTKIAVLLITVLAFLQGDAQSLKRDTVITYKWYQPDFITLQFAGNIGFISGGVGYRSSKNRHQISFLYGYVPKSVADVTIHLVTLKNSFNLFAYSYTRLNLIPYLGLTASLETGNNSFLILPSRFRTGYHATNAFHATVYFGAKSQLRADGDQGSNRIEVFIEAGAADVFLFYKIREREVGLHEIVSLAAGLNFSL